MVIRPYAKTRRVNPTATGKARQITVMHFGLFGDSYDFVKRGILQLLAGCGRWSVHPMFTDDDPADYAADYRNFLGVDAVTIQSFIQSGQDRVAWLAAAQTCQCHLLIDPDTGLPFNESGRVPRDNHDPEFLLPDELVRIVNARPDKLTLVFDQSFHRNRDPANDQITQIEGKLRWIRLQGIQAFVYHSHATFFLVSQDQQVLADARRILLKQLPVENHPRERLI